jgi:hypothetical protein
MAIAVCAFLISLRGSGAYAQPSRSPHVVLNLNGCDPALANEVRRIASVELRAVVVEPTEAEGAVTHAVVACRGGEAELQVSDAATSKQLQRIVSLSDATSPARARLLALAIAELVAASWEELESNPQPKVAAVPPPPASMRALATTSNAAPALWPMRSGRRGYSLQAESGSLEVASAQPSDLETWSLFASTHSPTWGKPHVGQDEWPSRCSVAASPWDGAWIGTGCSSCRGREYGADMRAW